MSANGIHDDVKRAIALESAVEITAAQGNPQKTSEAAELFLSFLTGSKPQTNVLPFKPGQRLKLPGQ